MYVIRSAPANVFDEFISQVVGSIKNVDRQRWELHEKWRIINYCLGHGVLHLTSGEDGQLLEFVAEDEAEEAEAETEVEQVTA